jgi:hypothetical protein
LGRSVGIESTERTSYSRYGGASPYSTTTWAKRGGRFRRVKRGYGAFDATSSVAKGLPGARMTCDRYGPSVCGTARGHSSSESNSCMHRADAFVGSDRSGTASGSPTCSSPGWGAADGPHAISATSSALTARRGG